MIKTSTATLVIPGVDLAMAQGACANWEVISLHRSARTQLGTLPLPSDPSVEETVNAVPAGWTPLTGGTNNYLWMVRCAQ